jgi:hypothetical protein
MLYRILFVYFLSINFQLYAKVDTLKVQSRAMNSLVPNLIILPNSYHNEPLPVIYLLHGAGALVIRISSEKEHITGLTGAYLSSITFGFLRQGLLVRFKERYLTNSNTLLTAAPLEVVSL